MINKIRIFSIGTYSHFMPNRLIFYLSFTPQVLHFISPFYLKYQEALLENYKLRLLSFSNCNNKNQTQGKFMSKLTVLMTGVG